MKIIVLVVLGLFTAWIWLAVDQNPNDGKKPEDEVVEYTQYRNTVTGELRNVVTVRCKICREVISQREMSLNGKLRAESFHAHRCGKYATHPVAQSVMDVEVNFFDWLEEWQRRLQFKR